MYKMQLYDQIQQLNNICLYEDVKSLCSMAVSLSEVDPEVLSPPEKYQVFVYHADACFYDRQYTTAESLYRKALQLRKTLTKPKVKIAPQEVCSEVELKYRLFMCCNQLKQSREAIAVLEGIHAKQRTAKINMALASLYQKAGQDRSAITAYKEVLRECPMSMEAARGLLSLWVKGSEVMTLMGSSAHSSSAKCTQMLAVWVKAFAFISSKDYNSAMITLKQLDAWPSLRDNREMLACLAEAQHLSGNYTQAIATLNRIHCSEPHQLRKMDVYASLLYNQKHLPQLEKLAIELMQVSEVSPEPWVAMGYYCLATRKSPKAIYFAQKAYTLDSWNIESLLLKGTALLELKKVQDSLQHFKEALKIDPTRFEAHKGLVDCHVTGNRIREAITCAGEAYRRLGQSARSLTLVASVLAKVELSREKAKSYLEKAMKLEPCYLEAVYCMVEILAAQQLYDQGIDLLSRTLRHQSTSRLHQLMGDFLSHKNEHQEALDQYNIALSLDCSNAKARAGLERVEKLADMDVSQGFAVDGEDLTPTDNEEVELDGSDMDRSWSDLDLS